MSRKTGESFNYSLPDDDFEVVRRHIYRDLRDASSFIEHQLGIVLSEQKNISKIISKRVEFTKEDFRNRIK